VTDQTKTDLTVLVDRSYSMTKIRREMQGALNKFLRDQRDGPGECRVTLAQFDTQFEVLYRDVLVDRVPEYVLEPRGATALLDALGRLITDTGARLAALPEDGRPGSVVFVVVTDGEENSSTEFTIEPVRRMIRTQADAYQWLFEFLGANMDAVSVAEGMGMPGATSVTYAPKNIGQTMSVLSRSTTAYRGARAGGMSHAAAASAAAFTDEDREAAIGEDGRE